MQLAAIHALAVGWLVACLFAPLYGSPQRPYWSPRPPGIATNYAEIENRFPAQIDHGHRYQGAANSPYESIDQFQLEQHRYFNPSNGGQESYYQDLLRVTESPLRDLRGRENFANTPEARNYYQDYLPLDENESYGDRYRPVGESNRQVYSDDKIAALMKNLLTSEGDFVPNSNNLEILNSLGDRMVAEASSPEESKRGVRQAVGQDPGLLWTLARLAFEKVNDTKSAASQISAIVDNSISNGPTTTRRPSTTTTTTTTSSPSADNNGTTINTSSNLVSDGTTTTTTSTTEAPFVLTRSELLGIIRRNLKGLVRLFRIEWQDAMAQSRITARDFQRDLALQVQPYFQDNPKVN